MKAIALILIASIFTCQIVQAKDKCYALVMEGGADLGAYEAGVIKGLAYNLPADQVEWDVFSGISVGAITAAGLNQFPRGQEKDMADWVCDLWLQIRQNDVFVNWSPGGLIQGLLFENGLFNNNPLRKLLKQHLTQPPQRMMVIGASDINTGKFIQYYENTTGDALINAVVASAAVPAVFPYEVIGSYEFFDGGVDHMMDFDGAVERCREIVDSDDKIVIDTLMIATQQSFEQWPPNSHQKTFAVYNREQIIETIEKNFKEYVEAIELFPTINFRYLIYPSQKLPGSDFPFFFKLDQLKEMIQIGYNDALKAIQMGEGVNHKLFLRDAYQYFFNKYNVDTNSTANQANSTQSQQEEITI